MCGEKVSGFFHTCSFPVQPHVCGEKALRRCSHRLDYGSTPRVWGKVSTQLCGNSPLRFNPTCVGKSSQDPICFFLHSVQPHVCGEKFPELQEHQFTSGSTPRVWGKALNFLSLTTEQRFNPTCVGKRCAHAPASVDIAVQPHVCGEKLILSSGEGDFRGSTPRVWGKVKKCLRRLKNQRFNPTCVGKSCASSSIVRFRSVQPHVCGEKSKSSYSILHIMSA